MPGRRVPIPPGFGPGTAWVSRGMIPQNELFIEAGMGAEVLTFGARRHQRRQVPRECASRFPRFATNDPNDPNDDLVMLDGVICLGQTGNACFWDNEKNGTQFTFTRGTTRSFNDFGGGSELIGSVAGVCTDCHAGENPYIIHGSVLGGLASSLPTFAPGRFHSPIVNRQHSDVAR